MTNELPSWASALRTELTEHPDTGFDWLSTEDAAEVTQSLLRGAERSPFTDATHGPGGARIKRSVPLATGPTRTVRLTQTQATAALMFDPQSPERVWLSLGPAFPAELWPSAEPTRDGVLRDLGPYLSSSFKSRPQLRRSLRLKKGSLETIGVGSLEEFAELVARLEPWLDGKATWRSGCDHDPWPEDPSRVAMIMLHVAGDEARRTHPQRNESITMRTLWSRSLLTIEEGPCESIIFDIRYDPAPFVTHLPADDGHLLVPEDLPVDLLASMIRGATLTMESLNVVREAGLTPYVAFNEALLAPSESTTYATFRQLLSNPEHRKEAAAIAADFGARGLVYEAACNEPDPELAAEMLSWIELQPGAPNDDDDDDQDDDDEDDDDVDDDEYVDAADDDLNGQVDDFEDEGDEDEDEEEES